MHETPGEENTEITSMDQMRHMEMLLDPKDYDVFINPVLSMETNESKFDWEYCLSFPSIRCMIKRPVGI